MFARCESVTGRTALLALVVGLTGCSAQTNSTNPSVQERRNAEVVRKAFGRGVGVGEGFYSILADDVHWTVARAVQPTTYVNRGQFLTEGAQPVLRRLTGPIRAEVHELITDGDSVVATWTGTATAIDGLPYVNDYAWVMKLRDEQVTNVVAYLDLLAVEELIERVSV